MRRGRKPKKSAESLGSTFISYVLITFLVVLPSMTVRTQKQQGVQSSNLSPLAMMSLKDFWVFSISTAFATMRSSAEQGKSTTLRLKRGTFQFLVFCIARMRAVFLTLEGLKRLSAACTNVLMSLSLSAVALIFTAFGAVLGDSAVCKGNREVLSTDHACPLYANSTKTRFSRTTPRTPFTLFYLSRAYIIQAFTFGAFQGGSLEWT